MIITERRYMVSASGAGDGNRPVEIQATVEERPRQRDGVRTRRRNDVCPRGQGLRHRSVLATERDAKKNKGADDCYHGRAMRMDTRSNFGRASSPSLVGQSFLESGLPAAFSASTAADQTVGYRGAGSGAGCCRRNSRSVSLGIDSCFPFLEAATAVPAPAPASAPIPAPFPPPAIPPMSAPRPAPPTTFFAVLPPSPWPFTS